MPPHQPRPRLRPIRAPHLDVKLRGLRALAVSHAEEGRDPRVGVLPDHSVAIRDVERLVRCCRRGGRPEARLRLQPAVGELGVDARGVARVGQGPAQLARGDHVHGQCLQEVEGRPAGVPEHERRAPDRVVPGPAGRPLQALHEVLLAPVEARAVLDARGALPEGLEPGELRPRQLVDPVGLPALQDLHGLEPLRGGGQRRQEVPHHAVVVLYLLGGAEAGEDVVRLLPHRGVDHVGDVAHLAERGAAGGLIEQVHRHVPRAGSSLVVEGPVFRRRRHAPRRALLVEELHDGPSDDTVRADH
mmetsp:Transcript_76612/g.216655  ORF Transcript_76612/g.216655 Transcript_76612/m.216655 type:complete len:302 (+) Transcript_76612:293-1198(+)